MRNIDFDREIAVMARRQHGVFHTRQARAVGGTPAVLRNRLANGVIIQLSPKVWAVAAHPPTWQRQYKAAELSVPGAALCDRAAAVVHALAGARPARPALVVTGEANRRQALASVRRSTDVPVTVVDRLRVTTVAQTLFDLLGCWPLPAVESAIDHALLARPRMIHELADRRDAMNRLRRPNVSLWRALVAERVDSDWSLAESELEVALHRLLRRLPSSVDVLLQATPGWWSEGSQRVDAYIPAWRLIIEADGRRWHARVGDFDRDRWRDNVAVANGHRVMRFTHTHLTENLASALALVVAAGATESSGAVPPVAVAGRRCA